MLPNKLFVYNQVVCLHVIGFLCKFLFVNHFKGKFVFGNIFLCKLGQKFFNKVSGGKEIITNSCLFTISYYNQLFVYTWYIFISKCSFGNYFKCKFLFGTFLFVNFENCFWRRRRRRNLMVRPAREAEPRG